MRKILFKIAMGRPCKVIHDKREPYLERYFLFNFFGLRFYLHRFVASDPDRGLHDHPWPWAISFILVGKYLEILRGRTRIVKWFNFITGDRFHRVILEENQEVWSLFIHPNSDVKEWGFLRIPDYADYEKCPCDLGDSKLYIPWKPREWKVGDKKVDWEKVAKKGKEFKRDSRGIIIIEDCR